MNSDPLLALLLVLIIPFLILSRSAGANLLYRDCSNGTTINTQFENNLKLLLQNLTSKTPLTGFNNTSIGDFPDAVHGQALCRGDTDATACKTCVSTAGQELLEKCKSRDGIIWYESCQVRYSYQRFFSTQVYVGKYVDLESHKKNVSNPSSFNEILMYLLKNISSEAAYNPLKQMFVTGEIKFSEKETIYGLVQCTRDIQGSDCKYCLDPALADLRGDCYSCQGGIIVSRNCNVRYELHRFYNSSMNLLTYPTSKGKKWEAWMVALVVCIPVSVLTVFIGSLSCIFCHRRRGQEEDEKRSQLALLEELATPKGMPMTQEFDLMSHEELTFMDLATIKAATDDFSDSNKIGQGGFGPVYKGVLLDGKEIAVKRLSCKSWQGVEELMNEIILIANLQHRNLVRLLGCGIEGGEKLLVYEFMPNKSLDFLIFDSERRAELDWRAFCNVITGIARGLLYLHEDSRLKIIHRDLKPSNVLLDHEMVAKISDFGIARNFQENQNTANTRRVAGTHGYMAPEYAMEGLFSVKSDVFSFGVIMLEIISGKKNSGFYITGLGPTLLAYAWRLWNEGKQLEFVDKLLMETSPVEEIVRCMHIGLLCAQEDPEDRPTMSSVLVQLSGETIDLPEPKPPPFSVGRKVLIRRHSGIDPSLDQITDSIFLPR